jgi:hypothetical protein
MNLRGPGWPMSLDPDRRKFREVLPVQTVDATLL